MDVIHVELGVLDFSLLMRGYPAMIVFLRLFSVATITVAILV